MTCSSSTWTAAMSVAISPFTRNRSCAAWTRPVLVSSRIVPPATSGLKLALLIVNGKSSPAFSGGLYVRL